MLWDIDFIREILDDRDANSIISIPLLILRAVMLVYVFISIDPLLVL